MVSAVDALGLAFILLVNTAVAALMTRFFRVRLNTRWGGLLYSVLLAPATLVALVLVFSGIFGLGPNLGSTGAVIALTVVLPASVGIAFDYFWMPAPEEVTLPEQWQDDRPGRYE